MRRRTAAALGGLSDALLRDISIERSQIPAIARDLAANAGGRPGQVAARPAPGGVSPLSPDQAPTSSR